MRIELIVNNKLWAKISRASADAARVGRALDRLKPVAGRALEDLEPKHAEILARVLAASNFLGELLIVRPEWIALLNPDFLRHRRRCEGLRADLEPWLPGFIGTGDFPAALARLRELKRREMLRIAARDLARFGDVGEITQELSDLADVCLQTVLRICCEQFSRRYGYPWHEDGQGRWQKTDFCVVGLGKLGGQELNYSSDVDVLFVYSDEGKVFKTPPRTGKLPTALMTNHQFFNRLAEAFIAEVSRMTTQGMLFRIDLRLRPEGDAGPLCRSLGSYENYYAQWGRTWERMMLIKARPVAGSYALGAEFLESIQPFRFPRAIQTNVLSEIGGMKDRIEAEVVREGELDRNVKLGRGGIREIEFIVQSQQLLRAGNLPFLQTPQTLPAVHSLARYGQIPDAEARTLDSAYRFFRDVEHRLQMEDNLQTHTLPDNRVARERMAKLMGFAKGQEFESARRRHSSRVRRIFEKTLKAESSSFGEQKYPEEFQGAATEWKTLLTEHGFRDAEKAFQVLREFVEGPGYVHVSSRTIELARQLLPEFMKLCPCTTSRRRVPDRSGTFKLSDPDRVVTRLDSFIVAYGARATLFELWNSNPSIFELLLKLFDRSEFLAELAIRTPDLVDDLVTSGRLRQRKSADETLRDLRHGMEDKDQHLWLRRYHQAELMRIGLRDILGLADPEQYLEELSALADACLRYALEVVARRNRCQLPPLAIIGLGKLGGAEIDYGSDLDILFVSKGQLHLRRLQRLAIEVMDLLSRRTEHGIVFSTDARLRPDGEKGLLVNTEQAFGDYYLSRAQLWEIQALTRSRFIAGNAVIGSHFQDMAARIADFRAPSPAVAYSVEWRQVVHRMRLRIERERTPAGKNELAIKTGKGGLVDAEFVAQTLCLANGWHEPNTLQALERGSSEGLLHEGQSLMRNYRELRRVEGVLRRWSYEGETMLPDEPAAYQRVAVRCGFSSSESFRKALAQWRAAIRKAYSNVLERG